MTGSSTPTVDFGAHLYPERVFPDAGWDDVAAMKHRARAGIGPLLTDPAVLGELYRYAGIDVAVLSQPYYMGHHDAERTARANDALWAVVEGDPAFRGLAAIPVAAGGAAAAAEFERCLDRGYHGGALATDNHGIELTDEAARPVLEVADATGAPLLVHPKLMASLGADVLDDGYEFNAIFGREVALATSLSKVIHRGVLDRYPDLTLVYHHLGGNIASMLGRVDLKLAADRLPAGADLKDAEAFRAQLRDRVYLDTSGFFNHVPPLRAAIELMPPGQVLYATDCPFEHRTAETLQAGQALVEALLEPADAERVLGGTAAGLLDRG